MQRLVSFFDERSDRVRGLTGWDAGRPFFVWGEGIKMVKLGWNRCILFNGLNEMAKKCANSLNNLYHCPQLHTNSIWTVES